MRSKFSRIFNTSALHATGTQFTKDSYLTVLFYAILIMSSFCISSFLSFGTFIPSSTPFAYSGGDDFLHLHHIKMAVENPWIYCTEVLGWPFGSNLLDYPMPDSAHYLLHKLFFPFLGNIWAVFNAHFLVGFSVVTVFSFWVFRQFSISTPLAVTGALIYANLPFHYLRSVHLFYTWYFLAPLFTWYSWKIFAKDPLFFEPLATLRSKILHALSLVILSCFSIYFTFFGMLMMGTAGSMAAIKYRSYKHLFSALIAAAIMVATLVANVTPNLIHRATYGKNPEVASRTFVESEIYGLKITPLLLPRVEHRFQPFASISRHYFDNTRITMTNGNITNSMGIISSVGFIALIAIAILNIDRKRKLLRLHFLSRLMLFLVLFATIGGFSVLFAMAIMPEIRAWDRINLFIAFLSITASLILISYVLDRLSIFRHYPAATWLFSGALLLFALWDQTTHPCKHCLANTEQAFSSDAKFVKNIEKTLLAGSAIYQLPYNGFPEMGPVNIMPPYHLLSGYLHSSQLQWSYGGMQGRSGDLFFRYLAKESVAKQIDIITKLGFAGVYIDRRGYVDTGKAIEAEFTKLLGPALITSDNEHLVFYKIPAPMMQQPVLQNLSPLEIMRQVNYAADEWGVRSLSTLDQGIDFRKSLPLFLTKITGFSYREEWGRWIDGKAATLQFAEPLPKNFILLFTAVAYGPNIGQPTKIIIGDQIKFFTPSVGTMTEFRVPFHLSQPADTIKIMPFQPIIPPDGTRELGIGLESLSIQAL